MGCEKKITYKTISRLGYHNLEMNAKIISENMNQDDTMERGDGC